MAPLDFLRAALIEGNDVRLSSRKAACSSRASPSSTGNPGSVYTNCETAVALRLITAKRLVRTKRVKRAKRTKLLLVTTISHRSWFGSSFAGYRADKSFVSRRRSKFVGHTPPRAVPPLPFLILILNPVSGGHATAKSFVSRRCSNFCFSRPPKRFR